MDIESGFTQYRINNSFFFIILICNAFSKGKKRIKKNKMIIIYYLNYIMFKYSLYIIIPFLDTQLLHYYKMILILIENFCVYVT